MQDKLCKRLGQIRHLKYIEVRGAQGKFIGIMAENN